MPLICCVCGPPGGGTTALRHQPPLVGVPCVDISNIYDRHVAATGGQLPWYHALDKLLDKVERLISRDGVKAVVVEGLFRPGGAQRGP